MSDRIVYIADEALFRSKSTSSDQTELCRLAERFFIEENRDRNDE